MVPLHNVFIIFINKYIIYLGGVLFCRGQYGRLIYCELSYFADIFEILETYISARRYLTCSSLCHL